jgi:hypothetical protein
MLVLSLILLTGCNPVIAERVITVNQTAYVDRPVELPPIVITQYVDRVVTINQTLEVIRYVDKPHFIPFEYQPWQSVDQFKEWMNDTKITNLMKNQCLSNAEDYQRIALSQGVKYTLALTECLRTPILLTTIGRQVRGLKWVG